MLIYNYQKEFIGIDEADLEVFGFANLSELKAEASDFADMFVRTPGYIHNFKHVHWIDFVTCAEPSEESKVIIEVNAKTYKATVVIETIYLSDSPTAKAYVVHLNNLRSLTVKENGEISEDVTRKRPKRVEPTVGFAFNAPQESEANKDSDAFDSPAVMQEIPELEGFKPFEQMEEVTEVQSDAPLDISFDDDPMDESVFSTTDTSNEETFQEETFQEENAPIEIEDAYSIDMLDIDTSKEDTVTPIIEEDDDFDYSYNYDPKVASDELGLPIDLIEEFIEDFIAQAKEFKEELFNSLGDGDLENVKVLSHKLKGVAANLRVEDAFNTLSIINTSSDATEVDSYLHIFYKIIAKLSGEEIQTTKATQEKPTVAVSEEVEDEGDLYEDDLIIGFKDEKFEEPLKEEVEISIEDDKEIQEDNDEFDISVKDSEVPQKIEMPELADDDFLNDTIQDDTQDDINIEDLLSIDIEDEKLSPTEETLDIEDSFNIEEDVEITTEEEPIKIEYSKETIASEIGLDKETFNEIFEDYIVDSKSSISTINEAILEDDYTKRKKETLKLKGMSDNMRVSAFNEQLNSLINSSDKDELTNAIKKIDAVIAQISK